MTWKDVPECIKNDECVYQFTLQGTGELKWCGQNLVKKGKRCPFKFWAVTTSIETSGHPDHPESREVMKYLKGD